MTKQPDQGWRDHVLNTLLPKMEASATSLTPAPANAPTSFGFQSLQPQYDPIDFLPPAAAEKLRLLRQRAADAHAIIPPFEAVREAGLARVEAANALKRLTDHAQDFGHGLPETDPLVVAAQKHLDKMTDDFRRLQELQEVRSAAWQSASQALANAETWLKSGRPGNTTLEAVEVVEPKLAKGEGILDAIERHRRRVRELRADLHRIASAPFPSTYAKQLLRETVEALAQRGTPDVSALVEHGRREIGWAMLRVQSEVHGAQRSLAFHEAVDVVGLFAAILKPAMISFLDTLVDAENDDAAALSHEARQKAEAETVSDLLDIERQEAALVFAGWSQGLPCEHRADCSPLAILQVQLITVPRAPSGPSSPEHAYDLIQPGGGRR